MRLRASCLESREQTGAEETAGDPLEDTGDLVTTKDWVIGGVVVIITFALDRLIELKVIVMYVFP